MRRVSKHFSTAKQASAYQNRLYNRYERVTLLSAPRFTECGLYVWEVGDTTNE